MSAEQERLNVTYNQIHQMCEENAKKIYDEFKPDLMIAIGGGGFIPARILRTFLKKPGAKNIPIQAIGLSLYEDLTTREEGDAATHAPEEETAGTEVKRTQWLDFSTLGTQDLIGKRVLIVDEVDDTRTTLHYAVRELARDAARAAEAAGRQGEETQFAIFVVHNKDKPKRAELPDSIMKNGRYFAGAVTGDQWINYPWEQTYEALSKLPGV